MTDPYSILGVSATASDDEVKRAYRELARKYHPDNYQNNPLADLAEEKMKEINEAYEEVNRIRSGGGSSSSYNYGGAAYQNAYQGTYQRQSSSGNSVYQRVRQCINIGDLNTADKLLHDVQTQDAEWHFLAGSIAYRRGWLDEARQKFQIACSIDPSNPEYRQALNLMQQGGQSYRAYNTGGGMDTMDCCTTLMCLNCLCGGCS